MSDPMLHMGGEMNELMSTKMCSPMMIYLAVIVTSGLSVYITRNQLKRYDSNKMDNLNNLYTLNELKFMIVFGLILFGLCQFNQTTLAWVFLVFPVNYLLIQNLIIHIHVSSAIQSAPKEIEAERRYGVQGGAMVVPQDTQQVQQQQQTVHVPPPKPEIPMSTSISQPMGMGAGPSGFGASETMAYF